LIRHLLQSYRFHEILRICKTKLPLSSVASHYFVGYFFNFFLPTSIGGDVARIVLMQSSAISKKKSTASIFYERFFGFFSLIMFSVIALPFVDLPADVIIGVIVVFFIFILLAYLVLKYLPKLDNLVKMKLEGVFENLSIKQLFSIFVRYWLALCFGIKIDFIFYLLFIPLINIITLLPISINGFGTREAAFIYFFGLIGVVKEEAFLIAFSTYIMFIFLAIIGGVLNLILSLDIKKL